MSGAWAFVSIVFVLVVLAGCAGHNAQRAQDAEKANEALHERVGELERKLDKRNQQIIDLMVENYELHNLVNQVHGRGFIPQQFKHGREN